jgi:hypothetical protein
MFERLKSLPLTVGLTLLIWLYAESQVRTAPEQEKVQIGNVPVWVAGPPDSINQFDVIVEPRFVTVEVTGPRQLLATLKTDDLAAYLIIGTEDLKATAAVPLQKALRVEARSEVKVVNLPEVKFYFREKVAATRR